MHFRWSQWPKTFLYLTYLSNLDQVSGSWGHLGVSLTSTVDSVRERAETSIVGTGLSDPGSQVQEAWGGDNMNQPVVAGVVRGVSSQYPARLGGGFPKWSRPSGKAGMDIVLVTGYLVPGILPKP